MTYDPTAALARIRARGGFDRAEICLNGHVSHAMLDNFYGHERPFCPQCGAQTIQNCPGCQADIKGPLLGPMGTGYETASANYKPPPFCEKCGKPFPWTLSKIQAAYDLVDELLELPPEEREKLKGSIRNIASDKPQTELAVMRVKKAIPKLAKEGAVALKNLVVEVATETAKKLLTGQ